jgi:sensor histidine kinase YesM
MLIQPFIENAINHGLDGRRDKKGALNVMFYKEKAVLICEIRDNGIGRSNAQNNRRKGHKSRGMTIIKEKVETLKNSGIADIKISTKDLDPSNDQYPGTFVTIRIKNFEDETN